MKRIVAIGLVFALVVTGGSALLLRSALADPPTRVPYQGKLVKPSDGTPLSGTFSMTFKIYDAMTGGTQRWTETQSVTTDAKGLFNLLLGSGTPLPSAAFSGASTYLELAIGGETLSPRQQLGSVPYALMAGRVDASADVPGDGVVRGHNTSSDGYGVFGIATSGTGLNYGVYGQNASSSGRGVSGLAIADTGETTGVLGQSHSSSGRGVSGFATHGTGLNYGVYGQSDSSDGVGVYGKGGYRGVHAVSVFGTGVWAYGNFGTGVWGNSSFGIGVRADSEFGNPIEAYRGDNRRFYVSNIGDVYADGSYRSPAADFAELLPILGPRSAYQPGDVLVMGADGNLALAATPSDPAVVGVYSTQPGFLGGYDESVAEDSRVPLALSGIVPVKVSGENGAIRVGDLLTTSATLGHAMKATDAKPGTIIGKALESLAEGKGTIRMLVMLR